MTVKLNHTIVHARDKRASARFYAEVFGFAEPVAFGPFLDVQTANEVTLAFLETDEEIQVEHYAKGEINRNDGGRGVYFEDPAGNLLEIITMPYASG